MQYNKTTMDITCDRADFLKFIRCSIICKLSVDNFSKFNKKKLRLKFETSKYLVHSDHGG